MLLLQFSLLNIGPKSQALYIINDLVKKKKKKKKRTVVLLLQLFFCRKLCWTRKTVPCGHK